MHQLQLIGIKTNLESFVTTTLMEHMLNRHQLHLFLWVSKQWGFYSAPTSLITFQVPFTDINYVLMDQIYYNSIGADTGAYHYFTKSLTDVVYNHLYPRYWIAIGF